MFSMSKKVLCLVSLVLALSLVGNVQAADVTWTDAGPDHLWSTPANWSTNKVPAPTDTAIIDNLPGPTIANEGAVADRVHPGDSGTGALTMDGGILTTKMLQVGKQTSGEGTLYMKIGHITVDRNLDVGKDGTGTLKMTGGTIEAGGRFWIGERASASGHVDLDGGVIIAPNNFLMRKSPGAGGTMDVKAGTLIINGDKLSLVEGYIQDGWITAYGDNGGTLHLDYDVTNEGKTTLNATHMLNPNPAYGSMVPDGPAQLQWTLPEPKQPGGVVTCDVYFGTDPNIEANPKVVTRQAVESVSVTLVSNTTYYWALDLYDSSFSDTDPIHLSPIFTFNTANQPPVVNAGADVLTWLEEGVVRTGNLDPTVTDEGAISPYTVQWTVVSEPNEGTAVIQTANAEDTSITLSAVGEYVLQLQAFDGQYTGSDTVTITVYNDICEATQSVPDYEPFPGDLNGDCIVDDLDLAILQEDWLKDNLLTEEWFKLD